jgi:hypothetical protein
LSNVEVFSCVLSLLVTARPAYATAGSEIVTDPIWVQLVPSDETAPVTVVPDR